jgi:hypothetical protein
MSIPAWNQNNKFKLMMPCTTYGLRANQHKFTHYTSPGEAKHIAHTMRRTTNASIDTDPICKYNQTSKRDTEPDLLMRYDMAMQQALTARYGTFRGAFPSLYTTATGKATHSSMVYLATMRQPTNW